MASASLYRHRWLTIRLPIALLTLAAAWWLLDRVAPLPPDRLAMSTGMADGAYHQMGLRYQAAFARHGVQLELQPSAGSAQNLQRLAPPAGSGPTADLALVQGGFGWAAPGQAGPVAVQTLATVDIEAVWIFTRQREITSPLQLRGLHVAAGPQGSGHRVMAERLLATLRVRPDEVRWSPLSGQAAGDALLRDEVDALLMVAPASAPSVRALLGRPELALAGLHRTAAIAERLHFLEPRLLAQDALGPGLPPRDLTLLTTPTQLVARPDLRPALQRLAVQVAGDVHAEGGPFHRPGDFPNLRHSDFPTAAAARAALGTQPAWFERWLPFWWSQLLQRLVLIGVPLALIAWWLAKALPGLLRLRLENKVVRYYGELKFIENDLGTTQPGGLELARFNDRLGHLERALRALKLPPELAQRWYTLHQHLEFVRGRVQAMRGR